MVPGAICITLEWYTVHYQGPAFGFYVLCRGNSVFSSAWPVVPVYARIAHVLRACAVLLSLVGVSWRVSNHFCWGGVHLPGLFPAGQYVGVFSVPGFFDQPHGFTSRPVMSRCSKCRITSVFRRIVCGQRARFDTSSVAFFGVTILLFTHVGSSGLYKPFVRNRRLTDYHAFPCGLSRFGNVNRCLFPFKCSMPPPYQEEPTW